jgi:hypothetical protein
MVSTTLLYLVEKLHAFECVKAPRSELNTITGVFAQRLIITELRTMPNKNIQKAIAAAKTKRTIAHLPKKTRTALAKQAAAVAKRNRTGGSCPKTRAELYKMAKKQGIEGRSKMGRGELAKALGEC